MISLYFGLPGSGKTTVLCRMVVSELRKIDKHKSKYRNIWTNADINIIHPRLHKVPFSDMVKYDLGTNSLLLIDEAQLEFGSREYKNFSRDLLRLFTMHRHFKYDIATFTQRWDGLDINVRTLTVNVYYIKSSSIFPISHVYPVEYGVLIPKQGDTENRSYGEIKQGYFRWGIWKALFHTRLIRLPFYGLYDSFCAPGTPPHPLAR